MLTNLESRSNLFNANIDWNAIFAVKQQYNNIHAVRGKWHFVKIVHYMYVTAGLFGEMIRKAVDCVYCLFIYSNRHSLDLSNSESVLQVYNNKIYSNNYLAVDLFIHVWLKWKIIICMIKI